MSTSIQQIRSLIQDKPVHITGESIAFNGVIRTYTAKYSPIDATSVLSTPNTPPNTVNADTGLLTWAVAPGASVVAIEYDTLILSDQSIQDIIDINTDPDDNTYNLKIVAADCLDAIATNQALIQKVIKTLDLQTNGAALSDALRKGAKAFRDQVLNPDYQESTFDFAQQINDSPGWREKVTKDFMRNG